MGRDDREWNKQVWNRAQCTWNNESLWRRKWESTPVFSPGEFHGQRSLVGYNPWSAESDMTEWLTLWKWKLLRESFLEIFIRLFPIAHPLFFSDCSVPKLYQNMVRKIQHNICHFGGWNDGSVISVRVQRLSYNSFWHTNLKEIIYFASLGDNSKEKIKYTFEKKFK